MKIAMLSTFYPFRGGIAQFNANLYETLKLEHTVIPYTFTRQYPDFLFPGETQYISGKDKAIPVPSIPILDTANPFTYAKAAGQIKKALPDVLILRYWMSYFAPSLGVVAKKLKKSGCKVVSIVDNVIPHEQHFFDKPMTSWFLKQNSGFIVMSQSVQNDLLALHPQASSVLIPHPLYNHFGVKEDPAQAKKTLGLDPDKKTILFFGLIRDYKGLDLLIEAVSKLDESYQLVIAGESYGSFNAYDEQIKKANHPERIKVFNRYIGDDEVAAFFSASDVCVLPYRSATQSGIAAIAYHFEVPLIATDTGGLKESIEEPGTGLMVPEINAVSIAETIEKFYREDRNKFIDNIRKAKEMLSWDHFAGALIEYVNHSL